MDDLNPNHIEHAIEAILFASPEPVTRSAIASRLPADADIKGALEALAQRYEGRGIELVKIGDAYAIRTREAMAAFLLTEEVRERKLSRAAIETLAIIAYHQPTTRAEIEEIRGVAVSRGTLDLLLSLDWIRLGKRRETIGRPVTFLTTTAFLDHFGLSSPNDLPGIAELRSAGLLAREPAASEEEFQGGGEGDETIDDDIIEDFDYDRMDDVYNGDRDTADRVTDI